MTVSNAATAAKLALPLILMLPVASADSPEEPPSVRGKWERMDSSDPSLRVVKTHKEGITTLSLFRIDDKGKETLEYQHQSRYQTELVAGIPRLKFFNRTITAGPQLGRTSSNKTRYLYRILDDKFYEYRGIDPEDDSRPMIIRWQRIKD